ncbi:hypothetical protein U4W01_02700, partial [Escherichia coli]|nr:hypothetical protein [Escherichia coli]
TTDGDGSHGSTSKTPSYTKSVSWHHYPNGIPERPARFIKALQNYYHTPELTAEQFPWPEALN